MCNRMTCNFGSSMKRNSCNFKAISLFISIFVVQVIGVPLPFRENQGFTIPSTPSRKLEPHPQGQGTHPLHNIPRNNAYSHSQESTSSQDNGFVQFGSGRRRIKRQNEMHFMPPSNYNEQSQPWRNEQFQQNSNHHRQIRESPRMPQYQQNQYAENNNLFRQKRDTQGPKVQLNDWQAQQDEKSVPISTNPNGYCTTPDCVESLITNNNIRKENNLNNYGKQKNYNGNKIPDFNSLNPNLPNTWLVQTPNPDVEYGNNGGRNGDNRDSNKIPLPLQILVPPKELQMKSSSQDDRLLYQREKQFYGQYPLSFDTENYLNLPSVGSFGGDGQQLGVNVFHFDSPWTESSFSVPEIIKMRASSISFGDGLEIVRVVMDISEEDDDETNIEVEEV